MSGTMLETNQPPLSDVGTEDLFEIPLDMEDYVVDLSEMDLDEFDEMENAYGIGNSEREAAEDLVSGDDLENLPYSVDSSRYNDLNIVLDDSSEGNVIALAFYSVELRKNEPGVCRSGGEFYDG